MQSLHQSKLMTPRRGGDGAPTRPFHLDQHGREALLAQLLVHAQEVDLDGRQLRLAHAQPRGHARDERHQLAAACVVNETENMFYFQYLSHEHDVSTQLAAPLERKCWVPPAAVALRVACAPRCGTNRPSNKVLGATDFALDSAECMAECMPNMCKLCCGHNVVAKA